jgi:hypothetical protein
MGRGQAGAGRMTLPAITALKNPALASMLRRQKYAQMALQPGGIYGPGQHRKNLNLARGFAGAGDQIQALATQRHAMLQGSQQMNKIVATWKGQGTVGGLLGGSEVKGATSQDLRATYRDAVSQFLGAEKQYKEALQAAQRGAAYAKGRQ